MPHNHQSAEHPWRRDNRRFGTNRKFTALTAKNPHGITPTICPPGNAENCVLGMEFAILLVKVKEKAVGRVYVGYE